MLHQLLPAWRGRRVLLVGKNDCMTRTLLSLLEGIGARPACIAPACDSETLCSALQAGRGIVMIIPDLSALTQAALEIQLYEAREAGTPLVMLLADRSAVNARALSHLMRYAEEFSQGIHGDAVSIQSIWHENMPLREACMGALALGARYLLGDLACTGVFTL